MSLFEGVRVIDTSEGIAAPYATMFLADHGADVVKIESSAGDPYRAEAGFQTFNRGKRSCVLDLASDEGRDRVLTLARGADVFVVDTTQEAARKRGIDYERLRTVNPGLIYLAVPPYGERGPLVGRPASPALLAAVDGMMAAQSSYSGDPVYLLLPLAAYGTAALAAAAIAAALYMRERSGVGQRIEVSELAGSLALQVGGVLSDRVPPRFVGPAPMGSKGGIPTYRLFEAADGRWFFLGCLTADFFNKLLIAIDRADLAAHPLFADGPLGMTTPEARDAIVPLLETLFRAQPRDHWLQLFREADVPAQPVLSRDQYRESSLVAGNQMRIAVEHPRLGTVEMMGVPLVTEAAPGEVRGRAPLLGEHTDEVLTAEVLMEGEAAERPATRRPAAGPEAPPPGMLSGVRVLDLTSFIAGPVGPRHLATMGADVLKVEAPAGDAFRQMGLGFLGWNQGKRGIGIDLRGDRGREVLYRLVRQADVVVENYRPGVTERLGVDYATLREINPGLIFLTSPGYGDDETMRAAAGFDPLLQALSGAMHQQGGADDGGEPVFYTVALNDVMTPAIATFGVCAALYHRERAGAGARRGQRVRVSLARTGMAVQAAEFTRYRGSPAFPAGGVDFPGPSAGERWYRCKDGHDLFVEATTDAQRDALIAATGVALDTAAVAGTAAGPAYEALAVAFSTRPVEAWIAALDAAGVPSNAITPRGETLRNEAMLANGLVVEQQHPEYGATTNVGMLVHASETPGRIDRTAPALSEHAGEVLAELGYSDAERRALAEAGAVVLSQPEVAAQ